MLTAEITPIIVQVPLEALISLREVRHGHTYCRICTARCFYQLWRTFSPLSTGTAVKIVCVWTFVATWAAANHAVRCLTTIHFNASKAGTIAADCETLVDRHGSREMFVAWWRGWGIDMKTRSQLPRFGGRSRATGGLIWALVTSVEM